MARNLSEIIEEVKIRRGEKVTKSSDYGDEYKRTAQHLKKHGFNVEGKYINHPKTDMSGRLSHTGLIDTYIFKDAKDKHSNHLLNFLRNKVGLNDNTGADANYLTHSFRLPK